MTRQEDTHEPIHLLGKTFYPEDVKQVIHKASAVQWSSHQKKWIFRDVEWGGHVYSKGVSIPTELWHYLKRVYVDRDWSEGTTLEQFRQDIRRTLMDSKTQIFVYGYYRTAPPRIQWGFYHPDSRIAVVYDEEADVIVTAFKPIERAAFFTQYQVNPQQIPREEWKI